MILILMLQLCAKSKISQIQIFYRENILLHNLLKITHWGKNKTRPVQQSRHKYETLNTENLENADCAAKLNIYIHTRIKNIYIQKHLEYVQNPSQLEVFTIKQCASQQGTTPQHAAHHYAITYTVQVWYAQIIQVRNNTASAV